MYVIVIYSVGIVEKGISSLVIVLSFSSIGDKSSIPKGKYTDRVSDDILRTIDIVFRWWISFSIIYECAVSGFLLSLSGIKISFYVGLNVSQVLELAHVCFIFMRRGF